MASLLYSMYNFFSACQMEPIFPEDLSIFFFFLQKWGFDSVAACESPAIVSYDVINSQDYKKRERVNT